MEWDREPVQIDCSHDGITRQSFKDECDINRIVETYARTGIVPGVRNIAPEYGDAPSSDLFEAACVQAEIRSAEEMRVHFPDPDLEMPSEPAQSAPTETSDDTLGGTLGSEPETALSGSQEPQAATEGES